MEFDEALGHDPFILEWRHIFDREPPQIQSPSEAIGEKKIYAAMIKKHLSVFGTDKKYTPAPEATRTAISLSVLSAPIYFISSDMFELMDELQKKCQASIGQSKDLFVPRKMPSPFMWLTSPKGFSASALGLKGNIDARLEIDLSEGFVRKNHVANSWGFFTDETHGMVGAPCCSQDYSREALLMLIEEKICRVDVERPSRGLLRSCLKRGIKTDTEINVIRLRSYKNEGESEKDAYGRTIEYTRQWLVRGHVRNQFYPASNEHKLVWIDPYIKGPEDMPFKESIRSLVR